MPISVEEELLLLKYYGTKLQLMCRELRFPKKVLGSAVTYFKRFYLNTSALDSDPQHVVLTCLYLACKVGASGWAHGSRPLPTGPAAPLTPPLAHPGRGLLHLRCGAGAAVAHPRRRHPAERGGGAAGAAV